MKVLVIGGTLFIGKQAVQQLVKAGHDVTVLHRRPEHDLGKKVANLQADRNDVGAVKAAVAGKSFDVVFDNAYDWERGTPATVVEETARMFNGQISRYVFMSSVAAYAEGLNHHEGDALAVDDHPDRYVRQKAQSERALFRLHQRHGTPVVTIRPPFVYGPCNPFYREQFFWDRIREKRPIIMPGDGRRLMQFVYVKDLAQACVKAMEAPGIAGHAFNIACPRPLTQAEVVDSIAAAAGKPAQTIRVPREKILRMGGHPIGPKLYFGTYFDIPPITMIVAKAQRVLGFKPTTFDEGLKETYRWYMRHRNKAEADFSFEDAVLERIRAAS
jgi:nucleoside-diphosphate-sugar epimerase